MSKSLYSNNTTGYRGVTYRKDRDKWHAKIRLNNVRYHIGYFKSKKKAAENYDIWARRLFGVNAKLNFPNKRMD